MNLLKIAVLALVLQGCGKQVEQPPTYLVATPQFGKTNIACPEDMKIVLPSRREERSPYLEQQLTLCEPDSLGSSGKASGGILIDKAASK